MIPTHQTVRTASQLRMAVRDLLPPELFEAGILIGTDDEDDVTVTLAGVRLDGESLVPAERTYEVEYTITVPVSFTVTAHGDDAAEDRANEVAQDIASELSTSYFGDADVDDVDVQAFAADADLVSIREV